jgi:osmoprotectant transport system permease protein
VAPPKEEGISPGGICMAFLGYLRANIDSIASAATHHIYITAMSVIISVIIGVSIGIFVARHRKLASVMIAIAGVIYTIPSLALLGILVPFVGFGTKPTIIALVLYSQLMIIRNTYVGINSVDPAIIEASAGMGMTRLQILRMVELPLALPVIMAGIKNIAVMTIGIAAIAAIIGSGGLGRLIYDGIFRINYRLILSGVIAMALLSITSEFLLRKLGDYFTPERRRG